MQPVLFDTSICISALRLGNVAAVEFETDRWRCRRMTQFRGAGRTLCRSERAQRRLQQLSYLFPALGIHFCVCGSSPDKAKHAPCSNRA